MVSARPQGIHHHDSTIIRDYHQLHNQPWLVTLRGQIRRQDQVDHPDQLLTYWLASIILGESFSILREEFVPIVISYRLKFSNFFIRRTSVITFQCLISTPAKCSPKPSLDDLRLLTLDFRAIAQPIDVYRRAKVYLHTKSRLIG